MAEFMKLGTKSYLHSQSLLQGMVKFMIQDQKLLTRATFGTTYTRFTVHLLCTESTCPQIQNLL